MSALTKFSPVAAAAAAPSGLDEAIRHALSSGTQEFTRKLAALRNTQLIEQLVPVKSEKPLEEQLYEARARAKTITAVVAMHLHRDWRTKLFRQLDSLHDPEEWIVGDQPVLEQSFGTFLRAVIALDPARPPGLGLSSKGHLVCAWTTDKDRLTIEFLPADKARVVLAIHDSAEPERAAMEAHISRLKAVLAPYRPSRWFDDASHQSAA